MILHAAAGEIAKSYFTAALAAYGDPQHVGTRVPAKNRPDRFVRVFSNGGPDESLITTRAQIVAHIYDIDGARAARTAELIVALGKDAVGRMINGYPFVAKARKLGGPTDLDDPDLPGMARVQVVFEWLIRAVN